MASEQESKLILPIIDSHIHLFAEADLDTLAWSKPDGPLRGQYSVEQYKAAARSAPSLLGAIFVEADRKSHLDDDSGWTYPLEELDFLSRIARGQPREGANDGFAAEDARLCLAIIPWAPIPKGPAILEKFLDRAKEVAGDAWPKVRGFRYLVQDKPDGTLLQQDFIDAVKLLGRRGLVFEIGVDHHRRGKKQLDELVEFLDRVHDGVPSAEQTVLVINHICKPDLTLYNTSSDPAFHAWRTAMYTLSKAPRTYIQLSGGFSEMPDSLRAEGVPAGRLFESLFSWLGVVLATFGPSRTMFGSDWPVCEIGGGGDAWARWRDVVDKMSWMASLTDEEKAMLWGGTAKEAFGL
ncbi:amidohydrolase family protein [Paramyrothecium foliicola]|nr:amidohydrolase family protein [Paramyrothecium foliicola]